MKWTPSCQWSGEPGSGNMGPRKRHFKPGFIFSLSLPLSLSQKSRQLPRRGGTGRSGNATICKSLLSRGLGVTQSGWSLCGWHKPGEKGVCDPGRAGEGPQGCSLTCRGTCRVKTSPRL